MSHIKDETLRRMTLEEFCAETCCFIQIRERPHEPLNGYSRYLARLVHPDGGPEILDGGILISPHHNGHTPEEAIKNLHLEYSNHRLVIAAMRPDRREYGPFVFTS